MKLNEMELNEINGDVNYFVTEFIVNVYYGRWMAEPRISTLSTHY